MKIKHKSRTAWKNQIIEGHLTSFSLRSFLFIISFCILEDPILKFLLSMLFFSHLSLSLYLGRFVCLFRSIFEHIAHVIISKIHAHFMFSIKIIILNLLPMSITCSILSTLLWSEGVSQIKYIHILLISTVSWMIFFLSRKTLKNQILTHTHKQTRSETLVFVSKKKEQFCKKARKKDTDIEKCLLHGFGWLHCFSWNWIMNKKYVIRFFFSSKVYFV